MQEITFSIEDPASADAQWCAQQYFAELHDRFEGGYDPAKDPIDADDLTPPHGALVIARLQDRPVGCGAIKFLLGGELARFKRIWLDVNLRGHGIGRRLLAEMERLATESNCKRVQLDTNGVLSEAIAMYRRSGYVEIAAFNANPYAHHWFEKRLQ